MESQTFGSRLRHAWNAFLNRDPPGRSGEGYSYRPDRVRLNRSNDRTIMTAINTRIAMDAAAITINHVRLDENGRYDETVDSGLNSCLNLSGNKDQTGRALRYDMFLSMLDEGCIALVPIDVDYDGKTGKTRIESMRVGKVLEWYPDDVRLEVYNDRTGRKEEITLPKTQVALVENPFYAVMNEPNSTVQRLIRKLNLMDVIDEQVGSGKLDLIIQLPYVVRGETRKKQAEERRAQIEAARRFQIRHCLHRWHGAYHAAEPQPRKQPSEDRGIPDQHGIQPVGYHPGDHERYCFRCCDDQLREPHHRTHCGGCRGRDPAKVPDRGRPGEPGIRDVLP